MFTFYKMLSLIYLLLSLLGCVSEDRTVVTQASADGHVLIDAKVRVHDGQARFDCVASQSGNCHYSLFDAPCPASLPCKRRAFRQLQVATGEHVQVDHLPQGFLSCASQNPVVLDADCHPMAMR